MKEKKVSALDKIDMANCYRLVVDMSFFEPTDGPDHVLKTVTHEIKQFAINRLEMLLGDRPSDGSIQIEAMELPFTQEEVDILKMLIGSVKGGATITPSFAQDDANEELSSANFTPPETKKRKAKKKSQSTSPAQASPPSEPTSTTGRPRSEAQSNSKYQKVSPHQKPIPMPTQAEIDQIHAQEAHTYAGAFDNAFSGSIGKLLKE